MAVYPGFGVCYKGSQANWPSDKAYFKSIKNATAQFGIRPREGGSSASVAWSAGTPNPSGAQADFNAYWRQLVQQLSSDSGFYVSWGISGPNNLFSSTSLTTTNYAAHKTWTIAEATYLQQQGIVCEFVIGNELETFVDGSTLTVTSLNADIRGSFAQQVKAAYTLGPVSYGSSSLSSATSDWVTNGLGSLDTLSFHLYGSVNLANHSAGIGGFGFTQQMMQTFGNSCYISEFHVDTQSSRLEAYSPDEQSKQIAALFNNYILTYNVPRFFVFQYVGNLNADNQFAMQNTDGTFNPLWWQFFQSEPKYPGQVYK